MTQASLSAYQIMFVFVCFDLPTKSAKDRKAYATFRKRLLWGGFYHFQHSIYVRDCPSYDAAVRHEKRVQKILPKRGHVSIFKVTAKQFVEKYEQYNGTEEKDPNSGTLRLRF